MKKGGEKRKLKKKEGKGGKMSDKKKVGSARNLSYES